MSKKRELTKEWIDWNIDIIIGPSLIILGMKAPEEANKLRDILHGAIIDLYGNGDWPDTNAWVVASSDRLVNLYNTYMTAKLIHFFDNGVPREPLILTPNQVPTTFN